MSEMPRIVTHFEKSHHYYEQNIKNFLRKNFPEIFESRDHFSEMIRKKLPIIMTLPCDKPGSNMSFLCLYRSRLHAFKFFFDLVSQWLIPGKKQNIVLVNSADFSLPDLSEIWFTLSEMIIHVESQQDLEIIQRNIPLIETEIKLGIDSEYYAHKILEVKGVTQGQKVAMIQQHIATLIRRMPEAFSKDIFTEMQHILVLCHDDFKEQRSISHLSRLIGAHYLFRKQLLQHIKEFPERRHILLKLFKTTVNYPGGKKQVLAVMVGLNFLREKEVFEHRHLLKAIKDHVPQAVAIDQTFFINRKGSESITSVYMEIEKSDGSLFSTLELASLKKQLPLALQQHIGRPILRVFMPRNEEEIMRNILSLSNQLKYLRDIPQVFISFDEQTDRNLFFTVIFVRILKDDDKSIQEKIRIADSFLRYIHDRSRIVGNLRKKYSKEATVFRVKFPKENFLRGGDHDSIDLYKARQAVVNELSRILGEFRDFNGGMISKQHEFLAEVRSQLTKEGIKYQDILLENFFYSLTPVIMRTVLEPLAFKFLFQMLLEMQSKGLSKGYKFGAKMQYDTDFSYAMFHAHHRNALDEASKGLHKFHHHGSELVQGYVKTADFVYMGYIYRCMYPQKQIQFRSEVESIIEKADKLI